MSKELFYKVQEMIKSKKSVFTTKHDFLLKGLLFCHNCGRKLRICYRGKTTKIGYIDCSLARGKERKCKTCNYNYNKFEKKVLNIVRQICKTYVDKNELKKIYEKCKDNYETLIEKENQQLNIISNKIAQVSKKIDKIYLDSVNGLISNDDYFKYSKGFIEERERLKREKESVQSKINMLKEKKQSHTKDEEVESIINEFLSMENPSKKVLYELIDRIEMDEYKNIYIYFNFSELNMLSEELGKECIIQSA